jgi:sugar diacid utilization regulator
MSEYTDDVARYTDSVDEEAVASIVKHLGIALRSSRDAALVACSDASERERVRDSWLKKKLGLVDDTALDADVVAVCTQMKEDREKSRVTFYYLLADRHDKLADLR